MTLHEIKSKLVHAHRTGDQEAMRRLSQEKEAVKKERRRALKKCHCGVTISRRATTCSVHTNRNHYPPKIQYPKATRPWRRRSGLSQNEIEAIKMIGFGLNFREASKALGVVGTGVNNRLRRAADVLNWDNTRANWRKLAKAFCLLSYGP